MTMNDMEDATTLRPSRGSVWAVMLLGVMLVAGGASVINGLSAGSLGDAAKRRSELCLRQAEELTNARKLDAGAWKLLEARDATEAFIAYRKTEQTWTRTGGALLGVSLVGLVFVWARRRSRTSA